MLFCDQFVLIKRPSSEAPKLQPEMFELKRRVPMPTLKDGEVLVSVKAFSCDPTQRVWASKEKGYLPPSPLGKPMRAGVAGVVERSNDPNVKIGDRVTCLAGWATRVVVRGCDVVQVPPDMSFPLALASDLTQITAYVGLVFVGKVKPGDSVFVTGAAGATGSGVVQIAKLMGCKVIGSAGGPKKCSKVIEELGADACIDYRQPLGQVYRELRKFAPRGVDVFFDNVGGPLLDAGLANLAMYARVVVCGAISQYNVPAEKRYAVRNYMALLLKRATMQGFLYFDFPHQVKEARSRILEWVQKCKLKVTTDVKLGPLTDAVSILNCLYESRNNGKLVHLLPPKSAM